MSKFAAALVFLTPTGCATGPKPRFEDPHELLRSSRRWRNQKITVAAESGKW